MYYSQKHLIDQSHILVSSAREILYAFVVFKNNQYNLDYEKVDAFTIKKVKHFVKLLEHHNLPHTVIDNAKYIVCTVLDESIARSFGQQMRITGKYKSLVNFFYEESLGGEKFFDILEKLDLADKDNLPLLCFARYILALGFQGKYLLIDQGERKLIAIKNKIFFSISRMTKEIQRVDDNLKNQATEKVDVRLVKNYLYSIIFILFGVLIYLIFDLYACKEQLDKMLVSTNIF